MKPQADNCRFFMCARQFAARPHPRRAHHFQSPPAPHARLPHVAADSPISAFRTESAVELHNGG